MIKTYVQVLKPIQGIEFTGKNQQEVLEFCSGAIINIDTLKEDFQEFPIWETPTSKCTYLTITAGNYILKDENNCFCAYDSKKDLEEDYVEKID